MSKKGKRKLRDWNRGRTSRSAAMATMSMMTGADLDDGVDEPPFDVPAQKQAKNVGMEPKASRGTNFMKLQLTPEGQEKMEEVARHRATLGLRGSETDLVGSAASVIPLPNDVAYGDYNPKKAKANLDQICRLLLQGKFTEALKLRDRDLDDELVDAFLNMDQSLPRAAAVNGAIITLVKIGKSFYEYAGDGVESYVDDDTYDRIIARLRAMDLTEPTGIIPNGNRKTDITYPLLHNNMDKSYIIGAGDTIPPGVKESDSIEAWLQRSYSALGISSETEIEIELSPKVDGVSVNGTRRGALLVEPQTRGDESNSMRIVGLNGLEVGTADDVEDFGIQYEVFVTEEDRIGASEYLNLQSPYRSCRHAAAGIINRLCTKEDDALLRFLSFYPIEAQSTDPSTVFYAHYAERIDYIQNFAIVPKDMPKRLTIRGNMTQLLEKIAKHFEELKGRRETLSFAIDGAVLTIVDDDYQRTIGRNGRTNLYQMALKFDPAVADAEVKGLHLDNGMKGFRTIQIELVHPVFLGGVKYDHVPVLSYGLFEELGLHEGSIITVQRVGDVMPSITLKEAGNGPVLHAPYKCPSCGEHMALKAKKLYCANPLCRGNMAGRIVNFVQGIGVEQCSDAFAELVLKTFGPEAKNPNFRIYRTISDLFKLMPELWKEAGVNTQTTANFLGWLETAMENATDVQVLGSVGIPGVGMARAKLILKEFGGWKNFVDQYQGVTADLKLINAVGEAVGQTIFEALRFGAGADTYHKDLVELTKHMKNFVEVYAEPELKVGHTGITLSQRTRDFCREKLFEIVDGKGFDVLIAGDPDGNSSKLRRARAKRLHIFTEQEFLDWYSREPAKPRQDQVQDPEPAEEAS